MSGAKLTAANPSSQQAAQVEAMAVKAHEQADVNLAGWKLKSEVAKWMTYKDSVKVWQRATELQKRAQLAERDQKNQNLINDECDRRMPVRDVQCSENLATCFASCAQAWAEAKCVPVEELLHIYWIDLTIPGFNYNRSLLQSFSTLSAALTAAPETSVGIVPAPNCGPSGMEYTDAGVRKSLAEIPPHAGRFWFELGLS